MQIRILQRKQQLLKLVELDTKLHNWTGTTLHIKEHSQLGDGRMLLVNQGVEKFKILKVVQEKPVLICDVEVIVKKLSFFWGQI